VNEFALRALKGADIETHTCRHDPSEHHVSVALWTSRAMDVKVDVVRQEIGLFHDASLIEEVKYRPEATLLWRDQLALEPVHRLFGLHGVTELHRRLESMRATMTFKGPKVIT